MARIIEDLHNRLIDTTEACRRMAVLRHDVQRIANIAAQHGMTIVSYAVYQLLDEYPVEGGSGSSFDEGQRGYQTEVDEETKKTSEKVEKVIVRHKNLIDWQTNLDAQREMRRDIKRELRPTETTPKNSWTNWQAASWNWLGAVGMAAEQGMVRFGDTTIKYEVRRSQRRKKTVQVTVDRGGVQVAALTTTPDSELQAIVRKRAPWILKHALEEALAPAPKRFVSGETLPYLGRNVRLVLEPKDAGAPDIRFDHWRFRVSIPDGLEGEERYQRIRRVVVDWYRTRAAARLRCGVQRWWLRLGNGSEPQILIRDQRQRWGSFAPDGTLRFNWRVMMLAPSLVEYVIVHELVHLRIKNHSKTSGRCWRPYCQTWNAAAAAERGGEDSASVERCL